MPIGINIFHPLKYSTNLFNHQLMSIGNHFHPVGPSRHWHIPTPSNIKCIYESASMCNNSVPSANQHRCEVLNKTHKISILVKLESEIDSWKRTLASVCVLCCSALQLSQFQNRRSAKGIETREGNFEKRIRSDEMKLISKLAKTLQE